MQHTAGLWSCRWRQPKNVESDNSVTPFFEFPKYGIFCPPYGNAIYLIFFNVIDNQFVGLLFFDLAQFSR